ncbi:restriction endonuclease subunit S [Salinisphaera sp.]|uniref:restriction endonuclease subunit S n=1 Tax=Salinisphaera sp. TaxID=1914330 RepID=UPI000C44F662|nr:restriction endonuclease subunit S [Salinisphaera sp.]MBS62576.1 restriction endonuclease subunit S [Salinisphaera sp.]
MKRLAPYSEYKESGEPFLGRIPAHWRVLRNGRLFSPRNETGFAHLPILEVSLKTGVRVRDMDDMKRKQVMSDPDKYKRAAKGDIAYNMMRMWQGAVGIAPVDGLVSPAYVVAKPLPEASSRYFAYLFRTPVYMNEVDAYSRGIVKDRNRLYWQDFKRMPSVVPPIHEQQQIVEYLDSVEARAERFIHNKRRLVELLKEQRQYVINQAVTRGLDSSVKLKSSGVDWIGGIPAHWEIAPLKKVSDINTRTLPASTDEDYAFKYFDISTVGTGRLIKEPQTFYFGSAPSRARRVLQKGDTILSTVRTYLKAVYYIADEVEDWIASTGFASLTPRPKIHPKFLGLLIQSNNFIERVIRESVGVAYPAIAETVLGSLHVAYPDSIREQEKILRYIDVWSKAIDSAVAHAQREIELVKEYYTRLVSDVVTGQVDVRGVDVLNVAEEELPALTAEAGELSGVIADEGTLGEAD